MASIEMNEKKIELEDNSQIRDTCEELEIPFGCRSGFCGTCKIEVLEGENNLSELTKEEQEMGRDSKHRLACQATIKSGNIKIKQEEM